jgi:hypothetical protein
MTDFDDLDTMMEDDEDGHPSSKSNLAFSTSFFKPFRIKMKYFLKMSSTCIKISIKMKYNAAIKKKVNVIKNRF